MHRSPHRKPRTASRTAYEGLKPQRSSYDRSAVCCSGAPLPSQRTGTDRVRSRVVAMDPSSERELRDLRDPLVVAAFEGWNDAGSAASAAVDHLAETCDAELAFALDPDDFYDFQVNRPQVELAEDGERTLLWPTTELHIGRL